MLDDAEYDGIIIGAGHNGMILAGYLAKAGLKVAAFESVLEIGGGLDTHETPSHPGFYHNMHSVFHRMVTELPWYTDLNLGGLGLEYVRPDVGCASLLSDGRSILWYRDVDRTIESLARLSRKDAATFRRLHGEWQEMVTKIILPETYSPPVSYDRKKRFLEESAVGREYLRVSAMSPIEVVDTYFEDDHIRAMLQYLALIRGYDIRDRGLGFLIPTAIVTGVNPQLCKGTSHNLAHHLHKMVIKSGGEVFEQRPVKRILVDDGEACGVELQDGKRVRAKKFVASSLNPHLTFLELVGDQHLEQEFVKKVERFKFSLVSPILSVNVSLNEPPCYVGSRLVPDVNRAFMTIVGLDRPEDIAELFRAHEEGRLPNKLFFHGTAPTVFDASQAPQGKHTAFIWPFAPYHLGEGGAAAWDDVRDEYAALYLKRWREFAPNLDESNIISWFSTSPLDLERHMPNMKAGDQLLGELNANQVLDRRPLPELSGYRAPVRNLFLCGGSCHPSGNITGGPGYNAAGVIAGDLGIDKWWESPDLEAQWKQPDCM